MKHYECERCGATEEAPMLSMLPDGQCSEGRSEDPNHRWMPRGYV